MTDTTVSADTLREMLAGEAAPNRAAMTHTAVRRDLLRQIITLALEALALRTPSEGEAERCFICDQPFKTGEMVLSDVTEGLGHRTCFGEGREGYVKDIATGEPLGPDDPIPSGWPYEPDAALATPSPHKDGADAVGCYCGGDPLGHQRDDKCTTPPDEGLGVKVTDEMVERARSAFIAATYGNIVPLPSTIRAALTAALQVRS